MFIRFEKVYHGFTLLELLVVLAIISIIAGLIVPRISMSFASLKLKAGARGCAAILRNARNLAITSKRRQSVIFKLSNKPRDSNRKVVSCTLKGNVKNRGSSEGSDEDGDVGTLKVKEKTFYLSDGIVLSYKDEEEDWIELKELEYEIAFDHRGFSSGGILKLSYFKDREEYNEPFLEYILKLDTITGRVKIEKVD